MAVFSKILVPYDGSQASKNAANKAIEIAADQNAEIIGLKVVAFEGEVIPPSDQLWETIVQDLKAKARETLGDLESLAKAKNVPVTLEVKIGYVEEEVVALVNQYEADLIVMGLGDKIGMHRVSIRRLVKESPCPVMMTH